ncbi:hypothetical protein VOLCADRAFT_100471 [Volvox carteri f. nagariensis]|uniref:Uncharacterized protein n=1 Tax=Volvox carteri f. nagariensis TaxID=3068 RepID=D8UK99_VOLCA|nr:uncharacterized protein VOLCADRAFT_100471 [Volvox carteri f. nagariensis]EFJ39845.1 hypothetical protein VOLCADRAFT_100471 [Volvox carteri f. nagariensis]|eukprot:XP_002959082.1 hypothetical protein VOLCADRAFT_100471 [Volvox carteri f. nagariensis]
MDSPDPKRQRLEPTSSYNLRCRTLVTSSSIDPPDAKRQRLDTAASQSSTSTVGPPAVTTDSRSVTFHVTFTAGPTETNEDRLFAGAQSRYGSFIAGVNTAGQGIVIMQIDDVILGRLESSHAFGHRVTFANVDAASLPPFITSRFAGVTVGQFKVSSATRISVEPSSAVPMLYSARLRFPVYDVGSDRARPEDKHASDGSALLLIPHGGMFRGGPFRKFKAWVACGNGDSPDAGRVELAIRESAPDDFVAQLQAAADSSTPLYVYGAKISPSNSKAYMNSVFLSGSLVAAASAPGKHPPKRVHTFQAAVQRTTAATVPADTTDMVLAWEQRSRSALVLPSDGPHASATLSPNPTSVTVVGSLPVLPLVLTIGSRSYPVCTDSIAVMQQLPNYDEFFGSTSFADDNDRMAYAAYDSFTVTGTITTKTEGLGAFRALVGSTPTQVGGVPRIYTGLHVLKLLLRQAFVLFSSVSSVRRVCDELASICVGASDVSLFPHGGRVSGVGSCDAPRTLLWSCDVYSAWSTTRTLITHGPDVRAPLDPHFGRHGYASPQRMSCQYTVLPPIRRCWLLPIARPCRHRGFCHSPCTRQVMRYGLCLVGNEGPSNTRTRRTSTAATCRHDGYRASTPSCRLHGGAGCCRPSDRAGTTASAIHHALDRHRGFCHSPCTRQSPSLTHPEPRILPFVRPFQMHLACRGSSVYGSRTGSGPGRCAPESLIQNDCTAETNEDRLFAGAQSRYGSFIAGVNTAGQGIVIMQIDDVILGRLESSHAFGHRVMFANMDAASLPPFITSRFAGVTVGQFKASSATRISVEPSSAVPMLYSARLRFPVYDVGSDRARPEDKHASDGSALLLIPHGGMFRGGPFRKFKAWVACGNGDSPDARHVELAIRESAPDDFVAQLQAAADSSTPLYVYGAKISPSNSKAYMNSVFLSGSLVAAATAPGKRPPKRVHTFQAAVQRTTAATVPADTTDMVLAWEQCSRSALVLPLDGPHASATLSPNPTSVTVVGSLPVLPLVLTIGSRSYPVCTDSIAVMQQLPNYDEFFGSASFADDNDRMVYAAYDSFTVTGTITTKTEGRTTFITALQE